MKTYIITRFSIHDYKNKQFNYTRKKTKDMYFDTLFSDTRLQFKFSVFKNVTMPSIYNQTNQNYEWYIYSSTFMPEKYKQYLLEITRPFPKIKCFFIDNFKEFYEFKELSHLNYDTEKYCTVRLDDDDALCKNFIEILNKYKNKKGFIISFPNGIKFNYKNNKVNLGKLMSKNDLALGLTGIGMNIYLCGDHSNLHKTNKKFIYDKKPDMYLCCSGKWCDTKRKKHK